MRAVAGLATLWAAAAACLPGGVLADEISCVNIYHDETSGDSVGRGPINAIMLANLLGHWPRYEVRVRPIENYSSPDLEACRATLYVGTGGDSEVPRTFLKDFLATKKRVAWIGFGIEQLDQTKFAEIFQHRAVGQVTIDDPKAKNPGFYQFVSYKGSLFRKSVHSSQNGHDGAFEAVLFEPVADTSSSRVLAHLIHNRTHASIPYFLRSEAKFVVGDVPFAYVHEGDRYFAFADLLFDILGEEPLHTTRLAFARTEDIHGFYEKPLLKAALRAHEAEEVPVSIAHIPLFMDPRNAFGVGKIDTPRAANDVPEFLSLIKPISRGPRNAIIWHGVTHQFGLTANPHTGTSGDDYEFWNMVANRPVEGDGVAATLDRLALALPVFAAYGQSPRYWVTPHYHASALDNAVFGQTFPWIVGRVTYYPTSFGGTFTLPAADRRASIAMPSVTPERIAELKSRTYSGLDERSGDGETQMFPYEIYRDVYGQRIVPETLGYMSFATTDQTAFLRSADDMLADARRNMVVRDYWASFFYHPYIFASTENGGHGRYGGDTRELRKLFVGLKLLGFTFIGLPEFEASLAVETQESAQAKPIQ